MYTGIVQACLEIQLADRKPGLLTFGVTLPPELSEAVTLGASIAVNGCCFTVTSMAPKGQGLDVTFDAIAETQALTNLRDIEVGTQVNVERSAKQDVEIGGHVLSGHIIDTATVADIEFTENNCRMLFKAGAAWLKYVFDKGYLAINGASLTVAAVDRNAGTFAINLIPETLKRTNFSTLQVGDAVNIEVESQSQVIVDTVERIMAERYAAETTAQS